MSDEIRKENGKGATGGSGGGGEEGQPPREEARPRDDELYTPQGGGGGTGSGPIRDVPAVVGSPKTGPKEDLREDLIGEYCAVGSFVDEARNSKFSLFI